MAAQRGQGRFLEQRSFLVGVASAVGVIFIWSGFIVFSRMGVATALTPYDISALRFMVAGAITLPFIWRWWPRHLGWRKVALLVATGPGSIYAIMMYFGLQTAPAAYAGVFANGTLPVFAMLLAALIAREVPGPRRAVAVGAIIAGGVMVAWTGLGAGVDVVEGVALFTTASAILSIYIFSLGRWGVGPFQALAVINIPNMAIFLPLWWFALPSGLAEAADFDIAFQALYQGLGPGFLALILFTLSTIHLGATPTAGFSAAVPAGAALLAIPVLGETPTPLEWAGIGLVTLGLIVLVFRRA